ncbi:MAG: hypothetical protein R3F05_16125 [Planctomycetota bacterium]
MRVIAEQDDQPIEGVEVSLDRIHERGYDSIGVRGWTDERGEVRLSPLTDAPMGIRISAPHIAWVSDRSHPVTLDDGAVTSAVLRARRLAMIEGSSASRPEARWRSSTSVCSTPRE